MQSGNVRGMANSERLPNSRWRDSKAPEGKKESDGFLDILVRMEGPSDLMVVVKIEGTLARELDRFVSMQHR